MICITVQGPIPKNKLVKSTESNDTTKPSITPTFKVIINKNAVIGCILGKNGKEKVNLPTVVNAVKIARSEIRSTLK